MFAKAHTLTPWKIVKEKKIENVWKVYIKTQQNVRNNIQFAR